MFFMTRKVYKMSFQHSTYDVWKLRLQFKKWFMVWSAPSSLSYEAREKECKRKKLTSCSRRQPRTTLPLWVLSQVIHNSIEHAKPWTISFITGSSAFVLGRNKFGITPSLSTLLLTGQLPEQCLTNIRNRDVIVCESVVMSPFICTSVRWYFYFFYNLESH